MSAGATSAAARAEIGPALAVGGAAGSAVYAIFIGYLAPELGLFETETVLGPAWLVGLLATAACAVIAWRTGVFASDERGERPRIASPVALVGAGLAWTLLGYLDMHVLGLDYTGSESASGVFDVLFHGSGVFLACLGMVLHSRAHRARRAGAG